MENTAADREKAKGRSAVSNGRGTFLPDSASLLRKARRYRDILNEMISDMGGEDLLSEAQRQLVRRAVTMSLQCEHWDHAAASGERVDWDLYSRTTNTLRRTLEAIGLQRVPRNVTDSPANIIGRIQERRTDRQAVQTIQEIPADG
jgi:hypothetical protein